MCFIICRLNKVTVYCSINVSIISGNNQHSVCILSPCISYCCNKRLIQRINLIICIVRRIFLSGNFNLIHAFKHKSLTITTELVCYMCPYTAVNFVCTVSKSSLEINPTFLYSVTSVMMNINNYKQSCIYC